MAHERRGCPNQCELGIKVRDAVLERLGVPLCDVRTVSPVNLEAQKMCMYMCQMLSNIPVRELAPLFYLGATNGFAKAREYLEEARIRTWRDEEFNEEVNTLIKQCSYASNSAWAEEDPELVEKIEAEIIASVPKRMSFFEDEMYTKKKR